MTTITVKNIDLYNYLEVYEITQWKNGAIYKTRSTGKFVLSSWENPDKQKFITVPVSTSLFKKEWVTLELWNKVEE